MAMAINFHQCDKAKLQELINDSMDIYYAWWGQKKTDWYLKTVVTMVDRNELELLSELKVRIKDVLMLADMVVIFKSK